MTLDEIDKLLGGDNSYASDSWKGATPEQKATFAVRMASRRYGWDPLMQAWGWYICGWVDGALSSTETQIRGR